MVGTAQELRYLDGEFLEMFYGEQGGLVPPPPSPFKLGDTMPWYEDTLNLDGAKNVGLPAGVLRTDLEPWPVAPTGGIITINDSDVPGNGILEGYDFGNAHVDCRAHVHLDSCMGVILPSNTANVDYVIRALNAGSGAGASHEVVISNSEFHNRSQKNLSTFVGRNISAFKVVGTGGSDIFHGVQRQSTVGGTLIGSAPANYLADIQGSFFGYVAWWVTNFATHAQTHSDAFQSDGGIEGMSKNLFGSAFFPWPSDFVGTGTPGSGRDVNPFFAVNTAATYNQTQATMEAERATYLSRLSDPATSFGGVAQKRGKSGVDTSMTGVMLNRAPARVVKNWFSGGDSQINFYDSHITDNPDIFIQQNRMWRDAGAQLFGRNGYTYPGIAESGALANTNDVGAPITVYRNA